MCACVEGWEGGLPTINIQWGNALKGGIEQFAHKVGGGGVSKK